MTGSINTITNNECKELSQDPDMLALMEQGDKLEAEEAAHYHGCKRRLFYDAFMFAKTQLAEIDLKRKFRIVIDYDPESDHTIIRKYYLPDELPSSYSAARESLR